MAQFAKLTATIAALAADQAVAHGLARIPNWIHIVEKDEAAIKAAMMTRCLGDAAVAIGTTKPKVTGAANVLVTIANIFYNPALGVDFWTLGPGPPIFNCTNAMYNKCLLCVDTAAAMQIGVGTEATTDAGVVLPATPALSVVVGVLTVHPTGVGNFVGGTTDLDDGTVIPNAVYEDVAFHPDVFAEITIGKAADATNVYIDSNMAVARDVEVIAACLHSLIL